MSKEMNRDKSEDREWDEYERVGREMRLRAGGVVTLKERVMSVVRDELEHLARVRRIGELTKKKDL